MAQATGSAPGTGLAGWLAFSTVSVLIGLVVAASFGSSDFFGGLASRRARTLSVLVVAQGAALLGAVILALAAGGHATVGDLAEGAAAGLLNVAGLGCLYRALAVGSVGRVAPVAAIIGAVIPVTWGLATGEHPSAAALAGVGVAVVAGGLVSSERDDGDQARPRNGLGLAVLAGIGFGSSLIFFAKTSHHSGLWPVLSGRVAAVIGVLIVASLTRSLVRTERTTTHQAVAAGILDVSATALLLVAVRIGLTATVAPVASLAPGFTVMDTWWFLHERPSPIQIGGLGLALVGLVLIAL